MTAKLTGPRLEAKSGRAKQLVVFLHGYGADGDDLIELGQHWRAMLPDVAFVSPHAHERCAGAPMGRQWFALSASRAVDDARSAEDRWKGARGRQARHRRLPRRGARPSSGSTKAGSRFAASARGR